jgi:hypothetical protein
MKKVLHYTLLISLTTIFGGCTGHRISTEPTPEAETKEHLEQNTAFALGLDKSDFTVDNRINNGVKVSYTVKANTGKNYNCYVTGSNIRGVGVVVSDAICNEKGKPAKNPLLR